VLRREWTQGREIRKEGMLSLSVLVLLFAAIYLRLVWRHSQGRRPFWIRHSRAFRSFFLRPSPKITNYLGLDPTCSLTWTCHNLLCSEPVKLSSVMPGDPHSAMIEVRVQYVCQHARERTRCPLTRHSSFLASSHS